MSLKHNLMYYAKQVETRLRDELHQLSGKSKFNIRKESQAIAADFKEIGYKVNTKFCAASAIKQDDFKKLAEFWKEKGFTVGTMQNKATVLRQILTVANNKEAIVNNAELNIAHGRDVLNVANVNKSQSVSEKALLSVKDKAVLASIKLIVAYGLRRDEALHAVWALSLGRDIATSGNLELKGSWCKNGRTREFTMRDGGTALRESASLVKDFKINGRLEQFRGGLDRTFKELKRIDNNQSLHPHSLRHNYAQERYFSITGLYAPAAGGLKYVDMNKQEKSLYAVACKIISEELGHSRESIARTYLGK